MISAVVAEFIIVHGDAGCARPLVISGQGNPRDQRNHQQHCDQLLHEAPLDGWLDWIESSGLAEKLVPLGPGPKKQSVAKLFSERDPRASRANPRCGSSYPVKELSGTMPLR